MLTGSKYLNYITPSPNREDPYSEVDGMSDLSQLTHSSFLSPRVSYKSVHGTYVTQSLDNENLQSRHRGYRRHRDINYDEEYKSSRKSYSRDNSFDSLDSERLDSEHSIRGTAPRSPSKPVTCMGADITGLVRRVKGMRVTMTPETCV